MVFAEEVVANRLPVLNYLIYWKDNTYVEDTWKSVKGNAHL